MKKDKKRIRWLELFNFINIVFFVGILVAGCLFAMTFAQVRILNAENSKSDSLVKLTKWRDNFFFMAAGVAAILIISTLSSGISVLAIKWQAEWTRKHKGGYGLLIILFSLILLGIVAIMLFTIKARYDLKYRPNQPVVVPTGKKGKKGQPQQSAPNPYIANQYSQQPQQPQQPQQNANPYMVNQNQQSKQPQQFPQNPYGQFNQNGYGMMPNQNQFYNQQPQQNYQYPQNNNHSQNFQYPQGNMQPSQQWNFDNKMYDNGNKK